MGATAGYKEYDTTPHLSNHASSRMGSRRISNDDVATVMSYSIKTIHRGQIGVQSGILQLQHNTGPMTRNYHV